MTGAVAKVVFDTNILVSGHFWKGPPYRGLLAAEARLAVLVLSEPVDAALSAGATIIVSGDRHLLALGTVEEIEILTARQFVDRFAAAGPEEPPHSA